MGEPSPQQIDEEIAFGISRGLSEQQIVQNLAGLERLSDEELAAMGVIPVEAEPAANLPAAPAEFTPVPVRRRRDGWTAERQRAFIENLAVTGCVSEACAAAGVSARSAYRLRLHAAAESFRAAWDHAQSLASARLVALAWERAVHGTSERLYKDGAMIAERRRTSDRLLMWLLTHHHPTAYGWAARPPAAAPDLTFFPVEHARRELDPLLGKLADVGDADCPAEDAALGDYAGVDEPPLPA